MTIGDLIDQIERIEELEKEIRLVIKNRDEYLHPDQKIEELSSIIGMIRSEVIE